MIKYLQADSLVPLNIASWTVVHAGPHRAATVRERFLPSKPDRFLAVAARITFCTRVLGLQRKLARFARSVQHKSIAERDNPNPWPIREVEP